MLFLRKIPIVVSHLLPSFPEKFIATKHKGMIENVSVWVLWTKEDSSSRMSKVEGVMLINKNTYLK